MGNSESAQSSQANKAARAGNEKKLRQILSRKKASVRNANNTQDLDGSSLLNISVQHSRADICSYLLNSGANVNLPDHKGYSPLHKAVMHNHDEKLLAILLANRAEVDSNVNETKRTPLIEATMRGNERMVELLVNAGADVNLEDKEGMTALHWAATRGYEALVVFLLDHKADVNARDKSNSTPLLRAKAEHHVNIVDILEKHFTKIYRIQPLDASFVMTATDVDGEEDEDDGEHTDKAVAATAAAAAAGGANDINGSGASVRVGGANIGDSNTSTGTLKSTKKSKDKKKNSSTKSIKQSITSKRKKDKQQSSPRNNTDGATTTVSSSSSSDSDDSRECKICFERPMDTVLLSCGHVAVCMLCSQYLQICPMCNAPIERVNKIFFS
eukprot:TRINITY_DN1535_c0_g1_i1.p1 TRINITY_DN1535_c0_g1~~TRINITY_DN1535_c0_g1_i1.p1  ORF type:complete len:386 (-),score=95.92 TRINITY_DN1535_c0_g1_i1:107-1264(-)